MSKQVFRSRPGSGWSGRGTDTGSSSSSSSGSSGSGTSTRSGGSSTTDSPAASTPLLNASSFDIISLLSNGLGGSDNALADLIKSLGIASPGRYMNQDQIADWNKQLMDMLLQYALTQEQRGYNEQLRDEQRVYDMPLNQLARMMGAGIGRDAALQMMSGGAGGSGAAVPYGNAATLPGSAIPATQSTLNGIQGRTAIANTVFGAVSSLGSLVSLGFSIPQAIQSIKGASIANQLSQKQLVGLQSADAVLSSLQDAVTSGVLTTKDMDGFSNATDALNYIMEHKDTNAFKGLFDNGAFGNVYGTKFGREMFTNAWNSVRQSKDSGTLLDEYIRSKKLDNVLSSLQADQIGAELEKIGAETQLTYQELIESLKRCASIDADIQVKNKQGEFIDIQKQWYGKHQQAEIANINANTQSTNVQTDINRDVFEVNHAGVPILKQKYIDELEFAAYKASTMNSPEARKEYWQAWMLDANHAHALAFMNYVYADGVGDFAKDHPELWRLSVGLNAAHAFEGLKLGQNAADAGAAVRLFEYLPK